jgi:ArsR family transcriptional regulator
VQTGTTRLAVLQAKVPQPPSSGTTELAGLLRALGDPTRLAMAAMLAREAGALCVCHLEARFALSQPTISHHLRVLREARLVTTARRGPWVYYALDRARLAELPSVVALLDAVDLGAPASGGCCR